MNITFRFVVLAISSVVMLSGCAGINELSHNLHEALQYREYDGAKRYIKKGADVNESRNGVTPLCYSSALYDYCVEGYGYTFKNHMTLFNCEGTLEDQIEVAKLLINKGAKVNANCGHLGNPLSAAAKYGNYDIAKILIDNGANVNAVANGTKINAGDTSGVTPAANFGVFGIAGIITANKVNAEDAIGGATPLMFAYKYDHIEVAKLLIAHGANQSARTNGGLSVKDFYNAYLERKEIREAQLAQQQQAAYEQRQRDKAESRAFWKGAATLATGVAVGKATSGYAPDQQTRMMNSSMKAVDSGDTSELTETTNQAKAEQAQSHKAKMQAIEAQKERDRATQAQNNRVANANNVSSYTPKLTPLSYPSSTKYRCVEKGKGSGMDYSEEKARAVALRYSRPVEGGMNNRKIISSEVLSCKFDAPWTKCVAETKSEVDSTAPCGGRGPSGGKSK